MGPLMVCLTRHEFLRLSLAFRAARIASSALCANDQRGGLNEGHRTDNQDALPRSAIQWCFSSNTIGV
jgi:hypothetical protein